MNAKDVLIDRHIHPGSITISVRIEGEMAYLTLRDNGGGIPEDLIGKILDPYFTNKESGTGSVCTCPR